MTSHPDKPLEAVVFGAGGRIAADYLAVLDQLDEFRIDALIEPDPDAARRLEAARRDPVMPILSERVARKADVAFVLTPPVTHEPLAIAAIEAGLHVFCEKPLATSSAAARHMFDAARADRRVLMMASKFRFSRDIVAARRLISDGEIGSPLSFGNTFHSEVDMAGRWNADPAIAGGGVLIDNGTHAVDLARFLLGDVARVRATTRERLQDLPVEDRVDIEFETRSGVAGRVELSWSDPGGQAHLAEVTGDRGSLALGWRASSRRDAAGIERTFGSGYDKRAAFADQVRHFAAVVRGIEAPRIDDRDALASVHFVAAAYRSIAERRWIELPELAQEIA